MLKMLLLPLLAVAGIALVLVSRDPAAGSDPHDGEGHWPASYVLDYGESVTLPDGAVLAFVDLLEDSRCPADAMCIWQGRAVAELALDGERFSVAYTGGADGATKTVDGLLIEVRDVQPYPLASQPSEEGVYQVTVSVTPVP